MKNILCNWKTTGAGVGGILLAAGHLLTTVTAGDYSSVMTDGGVILAGLVGLFAKDAATKT